jgi:hypothetical protein
MNEQLKRIKEKLKELQQLDSGFKLFGADMHKYMLNPTLTIEEIKKFETDNKVELPVEYVEYLTTIANGGAGPFYGVQTLEESSINFFDNTEKLNHQYFDLSKAFPHTESWNVEAALEELYEKIEEASESGDTVLEEQLYESKWELIGAAEHDYGRLYTTDFGCGVKISLIINGKEKGNMWTDDRTNDAGLYPTTELGNTDRITFLNWYELWLDQSLEKIKNKT